MNDPLHLVLITLFGAMAATLFGLVIVCLLSLICTIFASFWIDSKYRTKFPKTASYKWGYFIGTLFFAGVGMGLTNIIMSLISGHLGDAISYLCTKGIVDALFGFLGYKILQRNILACYIGSVILALPQIPLLLLGVLFMYWSHRYISKRRSDLENGPLTSDAIKLPTLLVASSSGSLVFGLGAIIIAMMVTGGAAVTQIAATPAINTLARQIAHQPKTTQATLQMLRTFHQVPTNFTNQKWHDLLNSSSLSCQFDPPIIPGGLDIARVSTTDGEELLFTLPVDGAGNKVDTRYGSTIHLSLINRESPNSFIDVNTITSNSVASDLERLRKLSLALEKAKALYANATQTKKLTDANRQKIEAIIEGYRSQLEQAGYGEVNKANTASPTVATTDPHPTQQLDPAKVSAISFRHRPIPTPEQVTRALIKGNSYINSSSFSAGPFKDMNEQTKQLASTINNYYAQIELDDNDELGIRLFTDNPNTHDFIKSEDWQHTPIVQPAALIDILTNNLGSIVITKSFPGGSTLNQKYIKDFPQFN